MLKIKNIITVVCLAVLFFGQVSCAHAWGWFKPAPRPIYGHHYYYSPHYAPHGRIVHSLPRGYMRLIIGGLEYFYWEGMFYRMMPDREYVIVPAPAGAVVNMLPPGPQPVMVDGTTYYNINGVTYIYTPQGYQVVPQPKKIIINNYIRE